MLVAPSRLAKGLLILSLLVGRLSTPALTLDELRNTSDLTPAKFASYFRDFEFNFRKEVQPPDSFLATQSGDCDDFSTLAAAVLRERGYTARLIAVRMPGITHVVCYVEEAGCYLDYNNRGYESRTVPSERTLDAIAQSVARSYGMKWVTASEFTYEHGLKRLVQTVVEPKKEPKTFASVFR